MGVTSSRSPPTSADLGQSVPSQISFQNEHQVAPTPSVSLTTAPSTSSPSSPPSSSTGKATAANGPRTSRDRDGAPTDSPRLHFCEFTNEPSDVCNSQWLMLWTTAVYATEQPGPMEQKDLDVYYRYFPDQCQTPQMGNRCYSEYVAASPPRVRSRRELMTWLCLAENHCRTSIGVKEKRFSYKDLMGRWRYEDGYL